MAWASAPTVWWRLLCRSTFVAAAQTTLKNLREFFFSLERPSKPTGNFFSHWNDPQNLREIFFLVGTTLETYGKFFFSLEQPSKPTGNFFSRWNDPPDQRKILFSRWNDPQANEKIYFRVETTLQTNEKIYFLDVCSLAATEKESCFNANAAVAAFRGRVAQRHHT